MKPIQVMFDEALLRRLAQSPEVKERGRSEVVRRAVDAYLRMRDRERIADQYRRAYASTAQVEQELSGWTDEGVWPED